MPTANVHHTQLAFTHKFNKNINVTLIMSLFQPQIVCVSYIRQFLANLCKHNGLHLYKLKSIMYTIFATIFDVLLFTTHKSNEIYSIHYLDTGRYTESATDCMCTSETDRWRENEEKNYDKWSILCGKIRFFCVRPLHGTNWMHVQA